MVLVYQLQETIGDLRPLFSSTIHKSQGSTFEKVFVNLNDIGACPDWETVARLLYVAITRASQEVYLYGDLPPKYRGG